MFHTGRTCWPSINCSDDDLERVKETPVVKWRTNYCSLLLYRGVVSQAEADGISYLDVGLSLIFFPLPKTTQQAVFVNVTLTLCCFVRNIGAVGDLFIYFDFGQSQASCFSFIQSSTLCKLISCRLRFLLFTGQVQN